MVSSKKSISHRGQQGPHEWPCSLSGVGPRVDFYLALLIHSPLPPPCYTHLANEGFSQIVQQLTSWMVIQPGKEKKREKDREREIHRQRLGQLSSIEVAEHGDSRELR